MFIKVCCVAGWVKVMVERHRFNQFPSPVMRPFFLRREAVCGFLDVVAELAILKFARFFACLSIVLTCFSFLRAYVTKGRC